MAFCRVAVTTSATLEPPEMVPTLLQCRINPKSREANSSAWQAACFVGPPGNGQGETGSTSCSLLIPTIDFDFSVTVCCPLLRARSKEFGMAYSMVKACRLVSTAMKARGVTKFPSPAPVIANHKKK
ncbi:hypothetical protein DAPPUDRAFT_106829 [Daphnia pulex]|uniref:Uncharacterized protein n=1 Tax=Daphnia pulex TaxID=6669 RepID=E9GV30_DAPPU|nr:hypothetical protein DAPPUDRAFT_106829 [Daphnia pulex]|eukprot:EFX76686.1 hypothetical protein DAPPUDRAFT_106829 [Daphnia pulex]